MATRRDFLKSAVTLGVAGMAGAPVADSIGQSSTDLDGKGDDREFWVGVLKKIATPVLQNLAQRQLKKAMPVEAANPAERAQYTHLEAFGRLLAGMAPWLANETLEKLDGSEAADQKIFTALAQASLDAATGPHSPDFMNFSQGSQPIVDAAFLAQGILRAPSVLWQPLDPRVQRQIIEALKLSRAIATPTKNNWVMFAAMVEAALYTMGEPTIKERFEDCVSRMLGWYKGDGVYGDGESFHWDYYNSFVIHPMLLDALVILKQKDHQFDSVYKIELARARRYAQIQERLIAPDGTFPSIGRSITYRFGTFHSLAQISLMQQLPAQISPGQVRSALTAVMRKMIEAPGTFDDRGWLQIGFCGHQPSLAEDYISTGSLYLCAVALLPLGLPPSDEFWSTPAARWTSQRIWAGESLPADHAIHDPSHQLA
jgi:hypothetical protein